jgi:hypothetical protein
MKAGHEQDSQEWHPLWGVESYCSRTAVTGKAQATDAARGRIVGSREQTVLFGPGGWGADWARIAIGAFAYGVISDLEFEI